MSTNQPGIGPQPPSPQPRRGMSTAMKVLIIVGSVFFVLLLLCCGGFILIGRQFAKATSQDPAVVKTMTDEITQIEIPEPLKPKMSMDMKVPITNTPLMKMAVYSDDTQKNMLTLVAMGEALAGQNEEQMRVSVEQSMQKQGVGGGPRAPIENAEMSSKELQIRSKPAKFTILKGQEAGTHSPRIQVSGVFQGRSGPVMLILDADASKLTPEKVDAMLQSIR